MRLSLIILAAGLTSCATRVVPNPSKITLEEAMASVGRGLVEMKQEQIKANGGQDFRSGLVASDAEVVFNIAASGTESGKLFVELSPIPASPPIAGKAGANLESAYSASRGNQITIRFKNLALEMINKVAASPPSTPAKPTENKVSTEEMKRILDIVKPRILAFPQYRLEDLEKDLQNYHLKASPPKD